MRKLVIVFMMLSVGMFAQSQKNEEARVAFAGKLAPAEISAHDAMHTLGLGCMLKGVGQAVQFFKITVNNNGSISSGVTSGNALSKDQMALLKDLPVGATITFSEVKVKFRDGSVKQIADGVYTIK